MKPKLSIIIPCCNSQLTLEDTLLSVVEQNFQDWEAIIVNDGSTDRTEEIALKWLKKDKRFKYFCKVNEGLPKARNYGITRSEGRYILPLDSDNLIFSDFTQDAIKILDEKNEIGVVHGNAEYFGEKEGLWKIEDFSI